MRASHDAVLRPCAYRLYAGRAGGGPVEAGAADRHLRAAAADPGASHRADRGRDRRDPQTPRDLGTVLHVKFVQDVAKVVFDGVFGDHQPLGELAIAGDALHEQVEHLALALLEQAAQAVTEQSVIVSYQNTHEARWWR